MAEDPNQFGPEAIPLATIATPMPDQTSDPRRTAFRFGCVEHDEKYGEYAQARSDPGDEPGPPPSS